MDDTSKQLAEDFFLRAPNDVRTTNVQEAPKASAAARKTELLVVNISDESKLLSLETLREIHGPNFKLDDSNKYADLGGKGINFNFWEERGNLRVQSVQGVKTTSDSLDADHERLRRYALRKLENYGFHPAHCLEAYTHSANDTDAALLLLYQRYMQVPLNDPITLPEPSEADLLSLREDEKEVLHSIYDNAFEERQRDKVWNLKFKIEHLLAHSPSEVRKAREAREVASTASAKSVPNKNDKRQRHCRYFARDGNCHFGSSCRFLHVKSNVSEDKQQTNNAGNVDVNDNELWFHVEVRFPHGSLYPYQAPYIFLKTTCHDIPADVRLRLSHRLYKEAREICQDGLSCVYSICELLKNDENLLANADPVRFPSPKQSLFHEDTNEILDNNGSNADTIENPTHYTPGQTSHSNLYQQRNANEVLRQNRQLLKEFNERFNNERYQNMMQTRIQLPAFKEMDHVLSIIDGSQVVVISGETGCGKSTQIPQFLLDNWFYKARKLKEGESMSHLEIICTQPRRLSAIGVAERVAAERLDRIGNLVGYQIRLESKLSSNTRLNFCTTGILLRRLECDPLLSSVTHVIVDEVHERSVESDFLLLILKMLLEKRPDLKVILMSATLNASLFSNYFNDAPVLTIPGRTFPVQQFFLEDILELCNYVLESDTKFCRKLIKSYQKILDQEEELSNVMPSQVAPSKTKDDLEIKLDEMFSRYAGFKRNTALTIYKMDPMVINTELIESVLTYIVEGDNDWPREGSIIVFLPGTQEIQAVHTALMENTLFSAKAGKFLLLPLHSMLSSEEQTAIFKRPPAGKRKIILSTNIAETSVTIDDCVFVVDYGLMKEKYFDTDRNIESLDLVHISRANAMQRKGRAGRVMPGICIHLYSNHRYSHKLSAQQAPEIRRVPLEQIVLRIKTLKLLRSRKPLDVLVETLEAPAEESVQSALNRLRAVGALTLDDELTPLGHHLSALPVDIRIGKLMLYGSIFQCLDSVLTIAACLNNKSPFVSPMNKRSEAKESKLKFAINNSDHLTMLNAYRKWLSVHRRSRYAGSHNYASENFLSLNTMQTIADLKYQFLELLVSIKFVPINVPRKRQRGDDVILELTGSQHNTNDGNNDLIASLLAAAFYPNVVKIMSPERLYVNSSVGAVLREYTARDLRFKTSADGYVLIHPSSVNSNVTNFQSPFLVYQEKVLTNALFIRASSMVPLMGLLLFAGSDFKIELHKKDFFFVLQEGWILVKAQSYETAEVINCIRSELFKLLEEKIRDPCLNLLYHKNGKALIANIVQLISPTATSTNYAST